MMHAPHEAPSAALKSTPSSASTRGQFVFVGALSLLFVVGMPPWDVWFADGALDPSWALFLGYAMEHHWRFGEQVVFTYGPLGFFWGFVYYPGVYLWALAWRVVMAVALAAGVGRLFRNALPEGKAMVALGLIAPLGLSLHGIDGTLMLIALVAALLHLREPATARPLIGVLVALAAFAGAIKFTLLVFSVMAFGFTDAVRLLRDRKAPLLTPALFVSFLLVWIGAGQELGDLPRYLQRAVHVAASYNEGQQVWGPFHDVQLTVGLGLFSFGLAVLDWLVHRRPAGRLAQAALVFLYAFTCFKSGLVRHDAHALVALHGVAIAAAFLAALMSNSTVTVRVARVLAFVGIAVAVEAAASMWATTEPSFTAYVVRIAKGYGAQFEGIAEMRHPQERNARLLAHFTWSLEQIRSHHPLPPIEGGVDIYPVAAAVPIAWGLDYRPRPVFQTYAANDALLLELNRAWLDRPDAPATILYEAAPIDGRLPTEDEAPSIQLIDERYALAGLAGDYLRLERRAQPSPYEQLEQTPHELALGAWLDLGPTAPDEVLRLALDVRPNLLGSVLKTLFKLPTLDLQVEMTSGQTLAFRLVPGIGRAGFVVSPLFTDTPTAAAFFGRAPAVPGSTVRRVRVTTNSLGEATHQPSIRCQLTRFRRPSSPDEAAVWQELTRLATSSQTTKSAPATLGLYADGSDVPALFAHAPSGFRVDAPPTTHDLIVGFGFRDAAWLTGETNGACFSVNVIEPAGERAIFQRCLDPRRDPADRGIQWALVDLSKLESKTIRFWISAGNQDDAKGDWTYWAGVRFIADHTEASTLLDTMLTAGQSATGIPLARAGDEGHLTVFAHAPARTMLAVPPDSKEFELGFGLRGGAWRAGSDGACFTVGALTGGAAPVRLGARCIDPAKATADRGFQTLRVVLPAPSPEFLQLEIEAGPKGDAAFDWTYWSNPRFR